MDRAKTELDLPGGWVLSVRFAQAVKSSASDLNHAGGAKHLHVVGDVRRSVAEPLRDLFYHHGFPGGEQIEDLPTPAVTQNARQFGEFEGWRWHGRVRHMWDGSAEWLSGKATLSAGKAGSMSAKHVLGEAKAALCEE